MLFLDERANRKSQEKGKAASAEIRQGSAATGRRSHTSTQTFTWSRDGVTVQWVDEAEQTPGDGYEPLAQFHVKGNSPKDPKVGVGQ